MILQKFQNWTCAGPQNLSFLFLDKTFNTWFLSESIFQASEALHIVSSETFVKSIAWLQLMFIVLGIYNFDPDTNDAIADAHKTLFSTLLLLMRPRGSGLFSVNNCLESTTQCTFQISKLQWWDSVFRFNLCLCASWQFLESQWIIITKTFKKWSLSVIKQPSDSHWTVIRQSLG